MLVGGLLAGQWEFPTVAVDHDGSVSGSDEFLAAARARALDTLLISLLRLDAFRAADPERAVGSASAFGGEIRHPKNSISGYFKPAMAGNLNVALKTSSMMNKGDGDVKNFEAGKYDLTTIPSTNSYKNSPVRVGEWSQRRDAGVTTHLFSHRKHTMHVQSLLVRVCNSVRVADEKGSRASERGIGNNSMSGTTHTIQPSRESAETERGGEMNAGSLRGGCANSSGDTAASECEGTFAGVLPEAVEMAWVTLAQLTAKESVYGLTTGQRKVLALVLKDSRSAPEKGRPAKQAGKKRPRVNLRMASASAKAAKQVGTAGKVNVETNVEGEDDMDMETETETETSESDEAKSSQESGSDSEK
jgi:hypothetical protein